jgi:hypothetical protein
MTGAAYLPYMLGIFALNGGIGANISASCYDPKPDAIKKGMSIFFF